LEILLNTVTLEINIYVIKDRATTGCLGGKCPLCPPRSTTGTEKHNKYISEVINAKLKNKQRSDNRRLNRFDVVNIINKHKLIVPLKAGETKII